ncbi:MAG: hypothetical protein NVSMB25_11650 [Thermoleophilaceae bacterium]
MTSVYACERYLGRMSPTRRARPLRAAALLALAVVAAAIRWRRNPSACPYNQRFWVEAPHPLITRRRLLEILAPQPGERMLEVGPGTGYYSLEIARRLGTDGRLHVLDLQREMLEHVGRRAGEQGIFNISRELGDARALPYTDEHFDAAYLVTVLGEIPDQDAALSELARVVRRGGRIVCGELFGDPHMVAFRTLRRRAARAGLGFERRVGGPLGYFARFVR